MPTRDTTELKKKIIEFLTANGPNLPVRIAKETELSPLFASAFLAELLSEKRLKISNMRVGSSPLYFIPGQEDRLEEFSKYLKSKEKEAFEILRKNKFLKDYEQEPAIRVALRHLRDFAVPFKLGEEILWRYFTIPEIEFQPRSESIEPRIVEEIKQEPEKKESKTDELDIFNKKQPKQKKLTKKKGTKTNEKFFNKVKEYLSSQNIEILDIISFNKSELVLRTKGEEELLLIAYNKKRINEEDIIKAYKKSVASGEKYGVISLGEPLKRITDLIEALKSLEDIKNINDNL